MMKVKTVYYTFKEIVEIVDSYGETRLAAPREDPMEYEYPIDFTWDTEIKAYAWRDEDAEAEYGIDPEESNGWILIRVTEEIV